MTTCRIGCQTATSSSTRRSRCRRCSICLIVGGGPVGTACAFRAKELGIAALVIEMDDLMKRIRDYAKEKPILPDYGGGDTMQFPAGGDLVKALRFDPIDKDRMVEQWKALYRKHSVPAQVGVELLRIERQADGVWRAEARNHYTKQTAVVPREEHRPGARTRRAAAARHSGQRAGSRQPT